MKNNKAIIKLTKHTANMIQYGIIIGVVLTMLYAFMNISNGNLIGFFATDAFMYTAVCLVFLYISWQWINNNLSKFPISIIERKNRTKQTKKNELKQKKTENPKQLKIEKIIQLAGNVFGLAFSIMVMIFLLVAHLSGTGETRIIWDHFGEMMIETVLFTIAFGFVVLGFVFMYKNLRFEIKNKKKMKE